MSQAYRIDQWCRAPAMVLLVRMENLDQTVSWFEEIEKLLERAAELAAVHGIES